MIKAYHRAENIDHALQLLTRSGVKTAVLASQSLVDARLDESVDEVVDLQALGLNRIQAAGARLTVEALVTLQTLLEHAAVPAALRALIRAEANHTFRNMRSISGLLCTTDAESQLVAALLVCAAEVNIESARGSRQMALAEFLNDIDAALNGGILTTVTFDVSGQMAAAHVARTPADKPIVAAVARRGPDGRVLLALSGVARTPLLVEAAQVEQLQPAGDFRGSPLYRREMALTLSRRVLDELG
ncbi:MAG: FAD binding domain-containing protein [Chloroflexi bacterium]|nr:FAD binding domain-containing protein [Chloroflexota bacterium]